MSISGDAKQDIKLSPLNQTDADEQDDDAIILRVYKRRWIVLLAVALLNNTNTISWIAYAPVGNYINQYYGKGNATWLSTVYMICTVPVGIFSIWAGKKFGLRASIYIAALANGIGSIIRVLSGFDFIPQEYRFPIIITGQAIASIAYPFIMFLPTKVAGSWFPENGRTIATTIGVMSNPLGVLMANLISPAIVHSTDDIMWLNLFTCIPSVIAMFIALIGVNRSEPKIPPTISASQPQMDFLPGLKACFTSLQYIILFFVMGGGIGMFNCLYTVMQSLLCPSGYTNTFSGFCAALMIIGGVVGATISGIVVDRTKLYEETLKICLGLAVVSGLVFLQLTLYDGFAIFLGIACFLFGLLGLATYPIGLELASECSFPVSEMTSTGLIVLSGNLQSIIYVFIMNIFAKPLGADREKKQVCRLSATDTANEPKDFTISIMIFSALAGILVVVLVLLFKPVYKRMEAEDRGNRGAADKAKVKAEENGRDKISLKVDDSTTQPLQA